MKIIDTEVESKDGKTPKNPTYLVYVDSTFDGTLKCQRVDKVTGKRIYLAEVGKNTTNVSFDTFAKVGSERLSGCEVLEFRNGEMYLRGEHVPTIADIKEIYEDRYGHSWTWCVAFIKSDDNPVNSYVEIERTLYENHRITERLPLWYVSQLAKYGQLGKWRI